MVTYDRYRTCPIHNTSKIYSIFNALKIEAAKNFVTPDIIYHGMAEEVRGLEDFKKWVAEDVRILRYADHNTRRLWGTK